MFSIDLVYYLSIWSAYLKILETYIMKINKWMYIFSKIKWLTERRKVLPIQDIFKSNVEQRGNFTKMRSRMKRMEKTKKKKQAHHHMIWPCWLQEGGYRGETTKCLNRQR